jgi:hypothetical protein
MNWLAVKYCFPTRDPILIVIHDVNLYARLEVAHM